jgi:holo-[acyl-carrier protein] synthase
MIGIDIVVISRIQKMIERFGNKSLEKFLSKKEIKLAIKPSSIAGFWAAKEAISKALGCGIGSRLGFHDIKITKDPRGAPHFALSKDVQALHPIQEASLSISHDGGFAIAVVAIIMQEGKD